MMWLSAIFLILIVGVIFTVLDQAREADPPSFEAVGRLSLRPRHRPAAQPHCPIVYFCRRASDSGKFAAMSGLGQKQTWRHLSRMSGLLLITTMINAGAMSARVRKNADKSSATG